MAGKPVAAGRKDAARRPARGEAAATEGDIVVGETEPEGADRGRFMASIAAQVSLYPLHQESLSPAIGEALRIFREHGLEVQPGAMSSVLVGDAVNLFAALREAFLQVAEQGHVVMVVTFSNACPVPSRAD
jgi:uncharacterized protein YqgV (UPF0045/DUF77 family)